MMNKLKFIDKFMSVLLIAMILVNTVPVTAFANSEQEEELFSFGVYDSEEKPVPSADISYKILSEDEEVDSGSLTTNDKGQAVISDKHFDNESALNISYTVSKDGYNNKEGTVPLSKKRADINLEKSSSSDSNKVEITFNKKGDGIVKVDGSTITDFPKTLAFEKSSKITIEFFAENNSYIKSISKKDANNGISDINITDKDENYYKETITAEDTITYDVNFGKKYALTIKSNIKATDNNLCEINLNNNSVTADDYTVYYKSGEEISLNISAKDKTDNTNYENSYGYQISKVSINNKNEEILDKNSYEYSFKIDSDTNI